MPSSAALREAADVVLEGGETATNTNLPPVPLEHVSEDTESNTTSDVATTVDEVAALEKAAEDHERLMRRVDGLWGTEPAYEEGAEDKASIFQQLYYGWIGDFIYKAAGGGITEKDLPQPVRSNRAYNSGKRLSHQVHKDLRDAHRWDPYIGCEVTFKGEPETHGYLRWVGCLQPSDFPRARLAGVEWTVPPRHRRVEDAEGRSPAPLHNGIVHGARLFYPHATDGVKRCSCEPVNSIELLPRQSPVPPPPAPVTAEVLWSLVRAHKYHILVQIPPKLITDTCGLLVPVLLELFVVYLKNDTASWGVGLAIVLGVFLTSVVQSCTSHKYDHLSIRAAAVFETSTTGVIFEKCMTVARKSLLLPETSVGRVMNIASSDVSNIGDLNWYIMYFWSAPFQLIVCIILLYRLVGLCAFASFAVLAITLPVQGVLSRWQQEVRERMASIVDQRIRRTNELLSGIRIVKFMGWEPRFLSFIERARNVELKYLKQVQTSYVAFMFVDSATPILVISVVFVLYHAAGNTLTPEVVFPTIALLNTLRIPFFMIPVIISAFLQCLVSSRRISTFLECDDTTTASVKDIAELYESGAAAVYGNATVHTFLPVELPKCRSRTKGMMARTLLWFKKRAVPENEWCVLGDDGKLDTDPEAEERANAESDKRLHHQSQHEIPAFTPTDTSDSDVPQSPKRGSPGAEKKSTEATDDVEDEGDVVEELHQLVAKDLLENVNAIFPDGKLTVVIGATGSGKSTLLGSLLGEYYLTKGELWATKSIAYVPQQPWIMNATLRNNILFFGKEESEKLKSVIETCQLEADLKVLVSGLETEIGEKGINLSGGQKARVSLARAVYADRDMYLLDDPLSALDAHVGSKIFHGLLCDKLKTKTRVLATHQLHLLPFADHVVVVRKGRVVFSGDYNRYKASGLADALEEDLRKEKEDAGSAEDEACGQGCEDEQAVMGTVRQDAAENTDTGVHGAQVDGTAVEGGAETDARNATAVGDEDEGKLMTNEEKAIGSVPWSTYLAYVRACGGYVAWGVLGAVFTLTEGVNVLNGVWLSIWSTQTFGLEQTTYLLWYLFVVFLGMFSSPLRSYLCYDLMRTGSRNMHHSLLLSVGVATMEFFDRTPLGRVLNRFTKDISILDDTLNDSYLYLFQYFFSMCSTIAIMTVAQPLVVLAIIPCGFIYFKLMKVYNASNRETRRIKSIAHSPVFTLLEESVNGQSTISVYGKEHVILREAMERLDTVYSALYMQNVANRWLGVRLEFISCLIVTSVAFFGVLGKQLHFSSDNIGLIALSLTTSLTLTETLNWLVRQVATVEANMNCVERILHYINQIHHEDMPEVPELVETMVKKYKSGDDENAEDIDVTIETGSPTTVAPHVVKAGSLEFRDVQMRYREGLPLVLRDVSFRIAPREKVGIVGRTGSGKSTLLLTFMRMVDICGGEIVVSGQPIRSYPLRELRKQFSMIPQDPVLFDGTVRLNVDPFLEASSAEVWDALELVGLRERIASEPEGIDGRVLEGGSNFSVGQRQLLCMARALLKKGSGFILMDEATANIDQSLDRHIQGTVMKAFSAYTVITIAHRLQTVAQYDKIIVMDHGVVAEMGSPRELVERPGSVLSGMVAALGGNGAAEFRRLAN